MNFTADGRTRANKHRAPGVAFVLVFHVILIYGLVQGLSRTKVEPPPLPPIETKIIEEVQAPSEEAPPPRPDFMTPPPPSFTPPVLDIAPPPMAAQTKAITPIAPIAAITLNEPAPPKPGVKVAAKIDLQGSPRACLQPEYPAASERLGEAGTSAISLQIGPDGKVMQSKVTQSSGFPRLDKAAITAFSRCKFFVGTTDGVPEASWFSIRYKWVVPQ